MDLGQGTPRPAEELRWDPIETAKRKGYLVTRTYWGSLWFTYRAWCCKQRIPVVMIFPRRKYAWISIDLRSARRIFARQADTAFERYLKERLPGPTRYRQSWGAPYDYNWHDIPIGDAPEIAQQLSRLAMEHSVPADPDAWPPRPAPTANSCTLQ